MIAAANDNPSRSEKAENDDQIQQTIIHHVDTENNKENAANDYPSRSESMQKMKRKMLQMTIHHGVINEESEEKHA